MRPAGGSQMSMTRRSLAALALPSMAAAQGSAPIRLIVPWPAGGGTDVLARAMAAGMQEVMSRPVVVENRAGANGIIGTQEAARARPDGTTILMATADTHSINPAVRQNLPYDPLADFAPLLLLTAQSLTLCLHPGVPAQNVAEFVALARARPGEINYASWGNGSTAHMAMELFALRAGVRLNHVPYRGAAPATNDLLAGTVQAIFTGPFTTNQMHPAGRLRCIGTTAAQRSRVVPDIPTFIEAGLPGVSGTAWYGLMAPAATPAPVLEELRRATRQALAGSIVQERLPALGHNLVAGDAAAFTALIRTEIAQWREVARAGNIVVE